MEEEAVRRGAQIWGNKTWKCDSFCLFATVFCLFLLSFVWLSFFDSGRKMLAEEQQCWRKKLWTWTEIPSLLFTSLLGTKNNSTNCLFSASLPMLYCITGANFLFSLCTVLVSIHRTWHNYVHNDFCTQSDFFFSSWGSGNLWEHSPSHGTGQRHVMPRGILTVRQQLKNIQLFSVESWGFPPCFLGWPHFPALLFWL